MAIRKFFKFILCVTILNLTEAENGFAKFTLAKIFRDYCGESPVSRFAVTSQIECAVRCSQDPECRRYQVCRNDCQLFQDGTECYKSTDPSKCSCYIKSVGCEGSKCTCPLGYYGRDCNQIVKDCEEADQIGLTANLKIHRALINIRPSFYHEAFAVDCSLQTNKRIMILTRTAHCYFFSFNRSMEEYEAGFGSSPRNRWIGFDKVLAIMNGAPYDRFNLKVSLCVGDSPSCDKCSRQFENFSIGNKSSGYPFLLSGYQTPDNGCEDLLPGNVSLVGNKFSTFDVDHTGLNGCPGLFGGGWWFSDTPNCTNTFLTGSQNGTGRDNFWLDERKKLFNIIVEIYKRTK